jgi:hypothetical protein
MDRSVVSAPGRQHAVILNRASRCGGRSRLRASGDKELVRAVKSGTQKRLDATLHLGFTRAVPWRDALKKLKERVFVGCAA